MTTDEQTAFPVLIGRHRDAMARYGRRRRTKSGEVEAELCGEGEAVVIGGGNSAGQAATYLARDARRVHLLVRGEVWPRACPATSRKADDDENRESGR